MADIKYEITESIGVLSESNKGWYKELNLSAGTTGPLNMTYAIGRRSMRKWVKV